MQEMTESQKREKCLTHMKTTKKEEGDGAN